MSNTTTTKAEANEILAIADQVTVINDGQVVYPVLTEDMEDWIAEHGDINSANYQDFCDDVDIPTPVCGWVGTGRMIELCDNLREAGADYIRF